MATQPFAVEEIAGLLAGERVCMQKLSLVCGGLGIGGSKWYIWFNSLVSKRKTEQMVVREILDEWIHKDPQASLLKLEEVLIKLNLTTTADKVRESEAKQSAGVASVMLDAATHQGLCTT